MAGWLARFAPRPKSSTIESRRCVRGAARWLVVGLLVAACSKESKPVAEEPRVPAPSGEQGSDSPSAEAAAKVPKPTGDSAAPSGAVDTSSMQASVSEESFDLKLSPSGSYQVGQAGQVDVVLDAKPPFKVNQEYPYSFTLNESAGLSFANMKLKRDAVKLEEKRAILSIPFTPQEAGERTVSGTFKFSVCTEEQCLIKKHELALAVNVK